MEFSKITPGKGAQAGGGMDLKPEGENGGLCCQRPLSRSPPQPQRATFLRAGRRGQNQNGSCFFDFRRPADCGRGPRHHPSSPVKRGTLNPINGLWRRRVATGRRLPAGGIHNPGRSIARQRHADRSRVQVRFVGAKGQGHGGRPGGAHGSVGADRSSSPSWVRRPRIR